jgi:hypothetical protein
MRVALTSTFVLALVALLVFGPSALDAYHDRQHRVVIQGPVSVYHTPEDPSRDHSNSEIARVTEKDALKVMPIRYEKDYMVVRVKLANGQQGYIFSGSDFQIYPRDDGR